MAMTLRLSEDQDRMLQALAEAEGVSKHEAALRAILERSARLTHNAEVRDAARKAIREYRPLLDRLAQ